MTRSAIALLPLLAAAAMHPQTVNAAAPGSGPAARPAEARAQTAEAGRPFVRKYLPGEYGGQEQNWAVAQDDRDVIYVGNNVGVLEYRRGQLACDHGAEQDRRPVPGERWQGANLPWRGERIRVPRARRERDHPVRVAARARAGREPVVWRRLADAGGPRRHLLPVAAVPLPLGRRADSDLEAGEPLLPRGGRERDDLRRSAGNRPDEAGRRVAGRSARRAEVRGRIAPGHPAVRRGPDPHRHARGRTVPGRREVDHALRDRGGRLAQDVRPVPRDRPGGRGDGPGQHRRRDGHPRPAGTAGAAPRCRRGAWRGDLLRASGQAGRLVGGVRRWHRAGRDPLAHFAPRPGVRAPRRLRVLHPPPRGHALPRHVARRVLPGRVERGPEAGDGRGQRAVGTRGGHQPHGAVLVVRFGGRPVGTRAAAVACRHRRRRLPD